MTDEFGRVLDPMTLESTAVRVDHGLWIGGALASPSEKVSLVVTLDEHAPRIDDVAVTEVREPFPDSRWQPIDTDRVTNALLAADAHQDGDVLIRCRHGLNRSALVAALLLRRHGWTPDAAIDVVRRARPGALSNPYFVDLVTTWPDDPMRPKPAERPVAG